MIEIRDLVVRYSDVTAVAGLSLRVPAGCLYGLLGPNGAGKSTTIACLGGLRRPDQGSITVNGVDVTAAPMAVKRSIGVVPQQLALYGDLTVRENLRTFGALYGLGGRALRNRCDWGLALAQLESRASARVATLSGGMQRRLNLACSLLHEPEIIVCDEPTTGVDPQSRRHLFDTIRKLHAEGRTVVYTTHYMEEVEALCDRVAIVDHGRIIAEDTLAALTGGRDTTRLTVSLAAPADPAAVRAALGAAGLVAEAVEPRARSLEDVFLEMTGRALRDAP